jgi:hypothetical protein
MFSATVLPHSAPAYRSLAVAVFALAALSAIPAQAVDYRHDLGFTAVNRNPWGSGPEFKLEGVFQDLRADVAVTIPTTGLTPTDLLLDILGIDSPIDVLSARVGGSAAVQAGIDFGYYVTGGRLNVNYPAISTLSIGTTPGRPGAIRATDDVPVSAQFIPGLDRIVVPSSTGLLSTIAGSGYAEPVNLPGFSITTFNAPRFGTSFPDFSVWGDAFIAGEIGVNLEVRGLAVDVPLVGKVCFVCKGIPLRAEVPLEPFTFVEIDPGAVRVPGLVNVQLDQSIQLPSPADVRLQLSSPNLRVTGGLAPGGTALAGNAAQPVITVLGSLDDFVPLVGPLLDGNLGPLGYTIASTDGGPSFGVYQDFRLEVTPRLRLDFSENVLVGGGLSNFAEFGLDDEISFRTLLTGSRQIAIAPTYKIDARFFNETGLSVDVVFDLDGPSLRIPELGTLGPLGEDTFKLELFRAPLFEQNFSLDIGAIRTDKIVLDKEFPALTLEEQRKFGLSAATVVGPGSKPGSERYRFLLEDELGNDMFIDVEGQSFLFGDLGDDILERILVLDEDLIVQIDDGESAFNLGSIICLLCFDRTSELDDPNPFLEDEIGKLYLTELFDFPIIDSCIECDPILGQDNRKVAGAPAIVTIGALYETDPIPEPATAALLAIGITGLAAGARRRPRLE